MNDLKSTNNLLEMDASEVPNDYILCLCFVFTPGDILICPKKFLLICCSRAKWEPQFLYQMAFLLSCKMMSLVFDYFFFKPPTSRFFYLANVLNLGTVFSSL